jgi:chromosome segregation ATPase
LNFCHQEREEKIQTIIKREQNLRQQLSDAETTIAEIKKDRHIMKAEIRQMKFERAEATNSYLDKIRLVTDTLQQQYDQENELRQKIESLTKQNIILADEKETAIEEGKKVVDSLNMELEIQSRRERELKEQVTLLENEGSLLKMEIENLVRCEAGLREEKETEIQILTSEFVTLSENMRTKISELKEEIMRYMSRENDLMEQIETAKVQKQKMLLEVDELKSDNVSSTRTSRELIEGMTKNEKELVEKVNELRKLNEDMKKNEKELVEKVNELLKLIVDMTKNEKELVEKVNELKITTKTLEGEEMFKLFKRKVRNSWMLTVR